MRISRIYHPDLLQSQMYVNLTDNAFRHVVQVLRLKVKSLVHLFNGDGNVYPAEITKIEKKQATVIILEKIEQSVESPLLIHLGQALTRSAKMDWIIQKSVELGVTSITPLITTHCAIKINKDVFAQRLLHWKQVIISACEQCGRNSLPTILPPSSLSDWLQLDKGLFGLVCDPNAKQTLASLAQKPTELRLLIGPEGGLSEEEIKLAIAEKFYSISLGPRILRMETAAVAIVAAIQAYWGDM